MKKILLSCVLVIASVLVTGCTPDIGGQDYSVGDSGNFSETLYGTIVSMRPVSIDNRDPKDQGKPGTGASAGMATGAILGSQVGGGRGRVVGLGLGALGGAVAGNFIENKLSKQQGFEYTIKLDDGRTISVAQGKEPTLSASQRVMVIIGSERTRVVPA